MTVLKVLLAIGLGLLSVIATEMVAFVLMQKAPSSIDLTGNFFLLVVLPSSLTAVLVSTLLLWRLIRQSPTLYVGCYSLILLVAYAAFLSVRDNPVTVVLSYLTVLTINLVLVMGTGTHLARRR